MADVKETCDENKMDVPDSSGSKDLSKSLPCEAFNNFLQGKRHMLVHDFQNAVVNLTKACEMYVNHFGEMAIECAEVYFLYGKALFRFAQEQSAVLGDALNDGSNEENSSESEDKENESDKNSGDEEEGEENEAEVNDQENKEEKEPSESTDSPPATVDEGSSEVKVEDNSETATETSKSTEAAESSEKEVKDKNEPEVPETAGGNKVEESMDENNEVEEDDMELAWNTLETAKSIFSRRDTVESQLKIAEILLLLAEISMESDNNAAAICDLNECLAIQKKHLKPDDRILAESYYQMGLVLMLDKQYHDALENFLTTKKILELRVENLKNTPLDEEGGLFASADREAEITNLENVLKDLKYKIDDTEDLIRNVKKELEELIGVPGVSSPLKEKDDKSTTNKPVTNITHLLKRKKPDEGTSEDSAKRIKITSVLNGDSKVTAQSNTEG